MTASFLVNREEAGFNLRKLEQLTELLEQVEASEIMPEQENEP